MNSKLSNTIFVILLISFFGIIGMIDKDLLIYNGKLNYISITLDEPENNTYTPTNSDNTNLKSNQSNNNLININTATKDELMALDGIGDKISQEIIDYRSISEFETIEDIKNVSGIGETKFSNISKYICVY